jgi:hypothetical protein
VRVDLRGIPLNLRRHGDRAGGVPGEVAAGQHRVRGQSGHRHRRDQRVSGRRIACGIGDHQGVQPARGAAHHLLGKVAAQAEADQHDARGGQPLQQGEDVGNGGVEVEVAGGAAVGS